MTRALLLIAALAACDVVTGLDELPTADLAPGCSGMRLLARGFGDGTIDPMWTATAGANASIEEVAGAAHITANGPGRTALNGNAGLDLRDDAISARIVINDPAASELEMDLYSTVPPAHALVMSLSGEVLHFSMLDSGAMTDLATVRYDPDAHRYWRIAQVGRETRWETSADGKAWDVRASSSTLDWVSYVAPQVAMTTPAGPFDLTIDELDAGAPAGVVCRASLLADDFSESAFGNRWSTFLTAGATIAPVGGQLVAAVDGATSEFSELGASTIYNLDGSSFTVHITQMPDTSTDANVGLVVTTLGPDTANLFQLGGTIHADVASQGAFGTATWDPATASWWRLRGTRDVLHWEISADGRTFTEIAQAAGLALDRVTAVVYLESSVANTAVFDSFNAPP